MQTIWRKNYRTSGTWARSPGSHTGIFLERLQGRMGKPVRSEVAKDPSDIHSWVPYQNQLLWWSWYKMQDHRSPRNTFVRGLIWKKNYIKQKQYYPISISNARLCMDVSIKQEIQVCDKFFLYIFLKVPPHAILGIKWWMIGQLTQH